MKAQSHYVVVKFERRTSPVVALLRLDEADQAILFVPQVANAATRAKDFTVRVPMDDGIEWIDGTAEARAQAQAAHLPVLSSRESQWLSYGQAYIKDRGAQGGRMTKGQMTDAKLKAVRKNWEKVWPAKSSK